MLAFLVTDAGRKQDWLGVFDLNEDVSNSPLVVLQRDNVNTRKEASRIQALLRFEDSFRIERRRLVKSVVPANDLISGNRVSRNQDLSNRVILTLGNLKRNPNAAIR